VEKVLRCDCGFEARGEHEDDLVAAVQSHARDAHGMTLSRRDALLLTFRAELDLYDDPSEIKRKRRHE
jgi:Protein of unknown function (DUF1059)